MRLEEVTPEAVRDAPTEDLKRLLARANQLYVGTRNALAKLWDGMVGVTDPIAKDTLLDAYEAITGELRARSATYTAGDLDHVLLAKRLRGVETATLPSIFVLPAAVSLGGLSARNPKMSPVVDVRIDAGEFSETFSMELEKRIAEDLMARTGKNAVVRRDSVGLGDRMVPLYDLVLVPRPSLADEPAEGLRKRLDGRLSDDLGEDGGKEADSETVDPKIDPAVSFISKPYVGEHAARQMDPGQFDEMRRENDKFGDGIDAIWGIKDGKAKLQSVRFDSSKFNVAEAKAWLEEHDLKTDVEPAKPKRSSKGFIKRAEERIVGGIVYSSHPSLGGPTKPDAQGDYAESEEIWEALKTWMLAGHPIKIMHQGVPVDCPLVECFFADSSVAKEGQEIPAGSWYIAVHVPEDQDKLWKAIEGGEITGFSMAGEAESVED